MFCNQKNEEHHTKTKMPSVTCYRKYVCMYFWTANVSQQLTHILSSFNLSKLFPTYRTITHPSAFPKIIQSINPPINTIACQLTSFEEVSPFSWYDYQHATPERAVSRCFVFYWDIFLTLKQYKRQLGTDKKSRWKGFTAAKYWQSKTDREEKKAAEVKVRSESFKKRQGKNLRQL